MENGFKKFTINGGLRLLLVPMKQVESATVLVMVKTGSRDEPEKLAGISHFLEHMLFKGTEKYPTPLSISSTIDAIGGEFNAFTSKEYTGFYVKAAVKHLPVAVDVLSQMLCKPLLESQALEREKGVIIEEINMYEDLPPRKVSTNFDELIFGKNSLGRETIGYKETVLGMSRDDFSAYLSKRYTAGRMVVAIAGGIGGNKGEIEGLRNLVKASFKGLYESEDAGWGMAVELKQNKPKVDVFNKETGQAHFVLGVPTFKREHKDRYVLGVLSTILGGNMSSRLFTEIREKRGLAYYVKSDIDNYFDNGYFAVHAGVDIKKINDAVKVTLEELKKIKGQGKKGEVNDEELMRAKEYIKGSIILELEGTHEVASLYVRKALLEKKMLTPKEILAEVDKVRKEDVVRVARKIFDFQKLNLAVIGPYNKSYRHKFLELLN